MISWLTIGCILIVKVTFCTKKRVKEAQTLSKKSKVFNSAFQNQNMAISQPRSQIKKIKYPFSILPHRPRYGHILILNTKVKENLDFYFAPQNEIMAIYHPAGQN